MDNWVVCAFARGLLQRDPPFGPIGDFTERILELATLPGQLVLDFYRCLRNDRAQDESLGFEGAESFRQHPISDVRNGRLDGRIAGLPLEKCLQNGASPTTTDELDSAVKAAANGGDFGGIGHQEESRESGA